MCRVKSLSASVTKEQFEEMFHKKPLFINVRFRQNHRDRVTRATRKVIMVPHPSAGDGGGDGGGGSLRGVGMGRAMGVGVGVGGG